MIYIMTSNKTMKPLILLLAFLVDTVFIATGCGKQADQLAKGWSAPINIAVSKDSLVGGMILNKWYNTIIAWQGLNPQIARLDDMSAKCFLMDSNSDNSFSWTEVQLTGVPHRYIWPYLAIDQASDKVFFEQGYMENDQLIMNILVGRMNGRVTVRDVNEWKWVTDKKILFGENNLNIRLNEPGKRAWPQLGLGVINGLNLYIPYCLNGSTLTYFPNGATSLESGPYNNGVFHSADSGVTWHIEQASEIEAWYPSLCKTRAYYYYFAASPAPKRGQGFELWFSRKPDDGRSWDAPKVVTKYFCDHAHYQTFSAFTDDNTVHVCWVDRRHEKRRFSLVYPQRENYEVAYCQRSDSGTEWSKDIILSKGFLYSYAPSMSVEGNEIVVAWAGVETADDGHGDNSPNDIYYVTSKDNGKTWAKPLKVTDSAKDGITSGKPQVSLLNGVIHLFYIQGKTESRHSSPGLTKLNQPPWPIYYTQRPFPD
jgi:hypothetical protein